MVCTCDCLTTAFYAEKNQNAKQKTSGHGTAIVTESGLDNNCSMLNVYDVVPQNRRIYIYTV